LSVYLDNAKNRFGRMIMCHMIADSTGELLRMADRIGVARKWLQAAGTRREHFDICLEKRRRAIALGAIPLTSRDFVRVIQNRSDALAAGKRIA
jgi:hypothetical protein